MTKQPNVYARLIGYLKPYWGQVLIGYASMMAATLLNLFVPQIIKEAIDQGLAADNMTAIAWAALLILVLAVVRGFAAFGQRYYGEWLTHRVAYDLRNDFYDAVQHLPFAFHDRAQTGDLMSRATSDITETERFVGIGLMDLVTIVLLSGGVIIAMFWENARLAADRDGADHRSVLLHDALWRHRAPHVQVDSGADGRALDQHAGEHDRHHRGQGLCP